MVVTYIIVYIRHIFSCLHVIHLTIHKQMECEFWCYNNDYSGTNGTVVASTQWFYRSGFNSQSSKNHESLDLLPWSINMALVSNVQRGMKYATLVVLVGPSFACVKRWWTWIANTFRSSTEPYWILDSKHIYYYYYYYY